MGQGRNETLALAKRKFEVEYTGVHYVTLTKNWNTNQWIRPRYNVVAQIVGTTHTNPPKFQEVITGYIKRLFEVTDQPDAFGTKDVSYVHAAEGRISPLNHLILLE